MKIKGYACGVPFWIKIDIDGKGLKWRLAFLRRSLNEDENIIVFPVDDFADFWNPARFAKYEQVLIERPE